MNMKRLRTGVAAATGGAVLVGGLLLGASIAMAQSSDQPTTSDELSATEDPTDTGTDGVRRPGVCRHLEDIADELGIDLEELRQQLEDGAPLKDLLEDAGIDPDSLLEDVRRFRGELGDRLPFPGRRWLGDLELDIDLDELREKIESGLTLDEALTELGVDVAGLVEDAREAALEHVDELLAQDVITAERAAELKERIESFELGEGLPFGPRFHFDFEGFDGPGFPRHHGNGFGFFDDDEAGTDSSAEESSAEDVLLDV